MKVDQLLELSARTVASSAEEEEVLAGVAREETGSMVEGGRVRLSDRTPPPLLPALSP